jgi:hypothetical protein
MLTLKQTNEVYRNTEQIISAGIELYSVNSQEAKRLSAAMSFFAKTIKGCDAPGEWEEYARFLQFLHRIFVCSPVPFNKILNVSRQTLDRFSGRLSKSIQTLPEVADAQKILMSAAKEVADLAENPLTSAFRIWVGAAELTGSSIIIVPNRRFIRACQEATIEIYEDLRITTPSDLRSLAPCGTVIFFGPSFYLLRDGYSHIFNAPLGERIINFNFSYFPLPKVTASQLSTDEVLGFAEIGEPRDSSVQTLSDLELDFISTPHRNLIGVLNQAGVVNDVLNRDLAAECQVAILGGGDHCVFLDVNTRHWSVSTKQIDGGPVCTAVVKVKTDELSSGDLLILTTESSGDLLTPYANRMLGREAARINDVQSEWKNRLSNYVLEKGITQTVSDLRALGCRRAFVANIRNWCSESNICPQDHEPDFKAILELVKFEIPPQTVFNMVDKLKSARASVAQQLQKSLLGLLEGRSLAEVYESGSMEIRREGGSATKTVFIIEEMLPDVVWVPFHRVNRVHALDEESF